MSSYTTQYQGVEKRIFEEKNILDYVTILRPCPGKKPCPGGIKFTT